MLVKRAVLLPPYDDYAFLSRPARPPGRPAAPTIPSLAPNPFSPAGGAITRAAARPAPLLEEEGTNSRDRIFSLRLTFECFVWQVLKPATSCREVVRAVQALFKSLGLGPVDEASSAFVQARQRLPTERLERALVATAQVADRRVGEQSRLNGRPSKWRIAPRPNCRIPSAIRNAIPNPPPKSLAAASRCSSSWCSSA